jgi:hypothetical protein
MNIVVIIAVMNLKKWFAFLKLPKVLPARSAAARKPRKKYQFSHPTGSLLPAQLHLQPVHVVVLVALPEGNSTAAACQPHNFLPGVL